MVADEGSVGRGFKGMAVDPEGVGAFDLLIRKGVRGVPLADPGPPGEGESEQLQAVIDQGSDFHGNGGRRQDAEIQLLWGNSLEVFSLAEEFENAVEFERQHYLGV